jgi:hypothetical protein
MVASYLDRQLRHRQPLPQEREALPPRPIAKQATAAPTSTTPKAPKPPKAATPATDGAPRAPKGPALVWTTGHTKGVPLTSANATSKDGALVAIAREHAAAGDGRVRVAEILPVLQAHPLFAADHAAGTVTAAKVSQRLSKMRKADPPVKLPPVGRVRGSLTPAVVNALNEGAPEYEQDEQDAGEAEEEGAE